MPYTLKLDLTGIASKYKNWFNQIILYHNMW